MAKKDHAAGPQAFEDYYRQTHGERWPVLRQSCTLPNPHFRLDRGLNQAYFLDPASVYAALQLDIQPGMSVLDLCAAPGGKSLVLALRLFGLVRPDCAMADVGCLQGDSEPSPNQIPPPSPNPASDVNPDSRLVANERSATRRGRLRAVLQEHLPLSCHNQFSITGHDATAWGQYQSGTYDRILLDIPCSSERHLIQDAKYLKDWSPNRTRQLAQQAYSMGLSAGQALKIGGSLLYCTCALSSLENDQAVQRIVERSAQQAERFGYCLEVEQLAGDINCPSYLLVESTKMGAQIWPDRSAGCGPLYFSRLKKVAR